MPDYSSVPLITNPFPLKYIGVTGSRFLYPGQEPIVLRALNRLIDSDPDAILVWGGCVGVDYCVAFHAVGMGMETHAVIPPNLRQVHPNWRSMATTYERIAGNPLDGSGYKPRNQRIVDLSDMLMAFPLYPEDHPESRRSGSWQTVRMARRKGIAVELHILSEAAVR